MARMRGFVLLFVIGVFAVALVLTPANEAKTQGRWSWPDSAENLKELPEDFNGQQLRAVMMGFVGALGVRCSYCHVGEDGQPLSTFDFPSDDNPKKDISREMLRLLGSVNDHLDEIREDNDEAVNMWCHTCHRGLAIPRTLGEELALVYDKAGIDSAITKYHELRGEYYGKGSYDFGEGSLVDVGFEWLEEDQDAAIALLLLNVDQYPESIWANGALANAYQTIGKNDLAIKYYEKALALDPENPRIKAMLERLQSE